MFKPEMLQQIMQMKDQMQESKKKLEKLTVSGEAGGNLIVVELTGNRKLKNLSINADVQEMDKEDLEDLLSVALERALKAVDELQEKEMANSAKGLIPGL